MKANAATDDTLRAENADLRARLEKAEEAEEALRAIRSGEIDALVLDSASGPRVFTLQGVDAEVNRFRGEMRRTPRSGHAVAGISYDGGVRRKA